MSCARGDSVQYPSEPRAGHGPRRFLELNKRGRELSQKKDWQGLRDILTEFGKELPGPSPTYLLRVASVEVHLSHNALALEWLRRYANMGLTYDVALDDDLKPLLTDPGFAKIAARMKENTRAIRQAEKITKPACTL